MPLVGAGMIQVGEFSFVLAELCLGAGAITGYTYSVMLGTAVITIVLAPFVFALISKLWSGRGEGVQVVSQTKEQLAIETPNLTRHVLICGHGRVGSVRCWDSWPIGYSVCSY